MPQAVARCIDAIVNGHVAVVQEIIKADPEAAFKFRLPPDNTTLLHTAATVSDDMFRAVLALYKEHSQPINTPDKDGKSPLRYAVSYGKTSIVKQFLEDGHANPFEMARIPISTPGLRKYSNSACHDAMHNDAAIIKEIIEANPAAAFAFREPREGMSLLHMAANLGTEEVFQQVFALYTQHRQSVDITDANERTSVMVAGKSNHLYAVQTLLRSGHAYKLPDVNPSPQGELKRQINDEIAIHQEFKAFAKEMIMKARRAKNEQPITTLDKESKEMFSQLRRDLYRQLVTHYKSNIVDLRRDLGIPEAQLSQKMGDKVIAQKAEKAAALLSPVFSMEKNGFLGMKAHKRRYDLLTITDPVEFKNGLKATVNPQIRSQSVSHNFP